MLKQYRILWYFTSNERYRGPIIVEITGAPTKPGVSVVHPGEALGRTPLILV